MAMSMIDARYVFVAATPRSGPASSATAAVTPLLVPGRPTAVSGVPGDTTVAVTWTAPDDPGSSPIDGYTATSSPGGLTCSPNPGDLFCTVGGLTDAVQYTFTVTATNELGTGLPSDPSPAVTPRTHPDAPVGVGAVASNGSASSPPTMSSPRRET